MSTLKLVPVPTSPAFKKLGNEVLFRQPYEVKIVNGKLVIRDLPESETRYLNKIQTQQWFEHNRKIFESLNKK